MAGNIVAIPPFCFGLICHDMTINYLALWADVGRWIETALSFRGIHLVPVEPAIAVDSVRLPGAFHADPADRLIVATARFHQALLLTADRAILDYGMRGHLQVLSAA
jgi:PIN domain nuclease of toxin-antitoxin system